MTLEAFRARRAESKRAAVLDAAETLFCKDGFVRTNMEKVAKEADVSTATLYRYFSNKEQLFDAVADRGMEKLQLDMSNVASGLSPLEALAIAYARFLSEPKTRSLFRMIVAECGRDDDLADRFYTAFKSKLSALFVGAVLDGIKAGELQKADEPENAAGQLQGMIEHGTIMRGLVRGDTVGSVDEAEATAKTALQTWLSHWRA
ncbi:MAG: TetR/AcrR family transcriptional regulator [Pseudomonadota bacterium]